jgi:ECF transporter S component (folate family)
MKTSLRPVQKLAFASMLLAMSIVMTLLAKKINMGSFFFIRFSLTPSLVVCSSLVLGPFYGILIGVFSDFIPAFLEATGPYNFLITIVYGVLGLLPWVIEKFSCHFRTALRKPYIFYASLALILGIVATLFYATNWLDDSFGSAAIWAKPLVLGATAFLDVGLCVSLYFWNRHYQKEILDLHDIPSPNEVAFISLISEVVVMDLLKALAFWVYYVFLANDSSTFTYGFVFSMLFMASSVDIIIMTFTVSWMLIFTKRYIHPLVEQNK